MDLKIFLYSFGFTFICCIVWMLRYKLMDFRRYLRRPFSKNEIPSTLTDLNVVKQAKLLLSAEEFWTKNSEEHCIEGDKLTLYCAIALSAKKACGNFIVNSAYNQTIAIQIDKLYDNSSQFKEKPISTYVELITVFNNRPEINYNDIISILDAAQVHMEQILELNSQN